MNQEKQKILDMIERGTITPADGAKLLECLGETEREESAQMRQSAQRMKGKKLRIQVRVPLVLARYADNILTNCVPQQAAQGMAAQGIDLKELNLSAIVDVFEELDEDILNVAIQDDENDLTVRIYVE